MNSLVAYLGFELCKSVATFAAATEGGLYQAHLHGQVDQPLERFLGVPVPEPMLRSRTASIRHAGLWPLFLATSATPTTADDRGRESLRILDKFGPTEVAKVESSNAVSISVCKFG
jgi:hypothetical protein